MGLEKDPKTFFAFMVLTAVVIRPTSAHFPTSIKAAVSRGIRKLGWGPQRWWKNSACQLRFSLSLVGKRRLSELTVALACLQPSRAVKRLSIDATYLGAIILEALYMDSIAISSEKCKRGVFRTSRAFRTDLTYSRQKHIQLNDGRKAAAGLPLSVCLIYNCNSPKYCEKEAQETETLFPALMHSQKLVPLFDSSLGPASFVEDLFETFQGLQKADESPLPLERPRQFESTTFRSLVSQLALEVAQESLQSLERFRTTSVASSAPTAGGCSSAAPNWGYQQGIEAVTMVLAMVSLLLWTGLRARVTMLDSFVLLRPLELLNYSALHINMSFFFRVFVVAVSTSSIPMQYQAGNRSQGGCGDSPSTGISIRSPSRPRSPM
ncbi:hypothetical protein BKA70DRAFT_1228187 [Coprinopsis sp. MPI-PUGE-AT-0042]|nr:hypothetical protein BKA70DRAFT_1228187 [Coprinopsis sp. MPI-PUGE-AT-0042]